MTGTQENAGQERGTQEDAHQDSGGRERGARLARTLAAIRPADAAVAAEAASR